MLSTHTADDADGATSYKFGDGSNTTALLRVRANETVLLHSISISSGTAVYLTGYFQKYPYGFDYARGSWTLVNKIEDHKDLQPNHLTLTTGDEDFKVLWGWVRTDNNTSGIETTWQTAMQNKGSGATGFRGVFGIEVIDAGTSKCRLRDATQIIPLTVTAYNTTTVSSVTQHLYTITCADTSTLRANDPIVIQHGLSANIYPAWNANNTASIYVSLGRVLRRQSYKFYFGRHTGFATWNANHPVTLDEKWIAHVHPPVFIPWELVQTHPNYVNNSNATYGNMYWNGSNDIVAAREIIANLFYTNINTYRDHPTRRTKRCTV